MVRLLALAAALLLPALALTLPAAARAEDSYTLAPLDTVEVKVARWEPATGTLTALDFLDGMYRIDNDGALDLPVAGTLTAAGRTAADLAAAIEQRLSAALAVADGLHASVRVEKYAPVFVVGAVEKPGEFEYAPGLTVLKAVALAGGVRRSQTLFSRTDRDAVRALGDHRLLEVDRWKAIAKLARLKAELAGEDTVPMPDELKNVAIAHELIEVETEILKTRTEDHASALTAIHELKDLLKARIGKLDEEQTLRQKLLTETRKEVESLQGLVKRGLAPTSRVNDASRDLADLETRMLDLETATLEAEQKLNEAERDEIELKGKRRVDIITALQDTRTEVRRIDVQLETQEALFAEAARFGTTLADMRESAAAATPVLLVTRAGAPNAEPFEATPATRLGPGDVLEVSAPELQQAPPLSALGPAGLGASAPAVAPTD